MDEIFVSVFDDGDLKENPEKAREEVKALLAIMTSSTPIQYASSKHPLKYVFQSVWARITRSCLR